MVFDTNGMASHAQAEIGAVKYNGSFTCWLEAKRMSPYPQRRDTADEPAIAHPDGKLFREPRKMIAMRLQTIQAPVTSKKIHPIRLVAAPANIAAATIGTNAIRPVTKARTVEIL